MSRGRNTAYFSGVFLALGALWWLWPSPEAVQVADPKVRVEKFTSRISGPVASSADAPSEQTVSDDLVAVRCVVKLEPGATITHLVAFGGRRGIRLDGQLDGDVLAFQARGASGEGLVQFDGYQRSNFQWATIDGEVRCSLSPPRRLSAFVQGRLHAAVKAMDGAVWVEGCGTRTAMLDSSGGFTLDTVPQDCQLRACRQAGQLRLCGPAVPVKLSENGEVLVDLQAPEYRPAGIGIELMQVNSGIRIGRVLPNTPGWRAGLEQGDVITSVDGESVQGMDLDEFISWAVGPEGTDVAIEVMTAEGVEEVVIRRGIVN